MAYNPKYYMVILSNLLWICSPVLVYRYGWVGFIFIVGGA